MGCASSNAAKGSFEYYDGDGVTYEFFYTGDLRVFRRVEDKPAESVRVLEIDKVPKDQREKPVEFAQQCDLYLVEKTKNWYSVRQPRLGVENYVRTGPLMYLTSTAFVTETQWVHFIQQVLARRGVLECVDMLPGVKREHLVHKYDSEIKKLKVLYINDAGYHRDIKMMAGGRAECHMTGKQKSKEKVGENGHVGRGEGTWFFWDQGLEDCMHIREANITMCQLLCKPWLFNKPGVVANHDKQSPNVANLDPKDEKAYFDALQLTQDAYNALKEDPPKVGAGAAGGNLPGCPKSGLNCADELAEISVKLNEKYSDALSKWCDEYIDGSDIIVGQGGEVVMLNMAWRINQQVAERLADAVHSNKVIYAGLSASTMVCAKSIQMTNEIQPGWIEAFACKPKYLSKKWYDSHDLNDDGVHMEHIGSLPILQSPIAMRPHYCPSWEAQVLKMNMLAEQEFEEEQGMDIRDSLVASSNAGCEQACKLLNLITANAKEQDNPVYVPIRNGKVIQVSIDPCDPSDHPAGKVWYETFIPIA